MRSQRAIDPKRVQVMRVSLRGSKANNRFFALTIPHSVTEKQPFTMEQSTVQLRFTIEDNSVKQSIEEIPIQDCTRVKSCLYFYLLSRERKPRDIFCFNFRSIRPKILVNAKDQVDATLVLVSENMLLGVAHGSCHRGQEVASQPDKAYQSSHLETLKCGNQDSTVRDLAHRHKAGWGSLGKPRYGACLSDGGSQDS